MVKSTNGKDIVFIIVFSILIFFGALFLFSSFKNTKTEKHVSIRAIDNRVNKQINKRIQKLHTKNRIFKSKISTSDIKFDDLTQEDFSVSDDKFELDVFENKAPEIEFKGAENAADKIRALLDSEQNEARDKEMLLEQYKEQLIQKAKSQGWAIKINDDLEVISAKPL